MKIIELKDKKLKELLEKRAELNNEVIEYSKQVEKMEKERTKLALQIQKVKDKVQPIVAKFLQGRLEEFEVVTSVRLEGGEPIAEVTDVVEDFKKSYREKKAGSKKD